MAEDRIVYVEKRGHIAWVVINRPRRMNACSMALFERLRDIMEELDGDVSVRVAVIRAEGRCFTVGLDLKEAAQSLLPDDTTSGREELRRKIIDMQACVTALARCRKPVIAAIHGLCYGAGVDIASACDIRIATKDAVFSIRETRMAIVADLGTLQRMPGIVGQGWLRELALTGRDFAAQEALQAGFITHICEDREALYGRADKLAREIADNAPLAVEGTKDVINYTRDHGIAAGLEYVAQKNAVLLYADDLKEALQAFAEKRRPVFKGC